MTTWPNWVDLLVVIIVVRTCYSGYARGFLGEILNLIGVISVTVLAINYTLTLALWLQPWLRVNPLLAHCLVFWTLLLALLVMLRMILSRLAAFMKWERIHWLIQGMGMALGGIRGFWWCGFILVALSSSGWTYLQESVEGRSVLGSRLVSRSRETLERVADLFPGAAARGPELIPPMRAAAKQ